MYTALVGQLTALATFLDAIPSSPAFTDKLRQLSEWFLVLTTRFHEIKSSPVVTEVVQKMISGIAFGRDLWTRLIDGYPSVKSAVELLTNFASAVFQAATKYFYNTVRNAFDHPVLQKIIHHRRLSGLSNHPVVQSLLEHPTFQNYPVKSVNHQHAAAINSFLGGVSVFAHDAHHDAEKVTMTLITPKSRIQKLRNDINAIDGDAKIDDNFYWVCVSVMTMITITVLSCLAVVLATKSSKHRSAIHAIAAVIIGIVAYFIHCFSPVLRSLDEDVHAFFKLIFMYTYMPLLALCALIYFWSWGKSDSDLAKQRERDTNKTVLVLQRQLSETVKNSTVSLEDSADMKLKLSGLNDALEAALKSKEEAVKELHAEKKRSADAPKTIIMQMEDDEDTMMMPTASSKASQSRSIVSDRKVDIKADVLAITAEKDTATAALLDSVRQIQDLTTQLEVSKVEWKGEKADVLAITAEKDAATAALSDSVKQIQDLTAQLGVSKVEWEGEKEALSAKVVTLTEQCKAYEEAKVDQVKQAQTKQSQSDKLTAGLQKQLSDLQTAQTTAVTDAAAAHTSIKESLEVAVKARADQKTKIKALRADIEIAIKSKDEALTQLQAEQTKILAITAEKDAATATLSDSVKQIQDLTTQLEVSKVQWEGEREVLGAKVATLTEQCKAVQAEKVEVEKSLQSTHTAAIEELRKQVMEMEAHTVQVSDNLKESESRVSLTRQDSKKFEADMKTKLGVSANDLIAAQKSQENTLQELHLEQKKSAVLETEKCTLENKISALTAECTAARQACDEARVQVQEGEEKLKHAVSSGAAGESSLHALSALMEETNQKLSAVKEELTASAARETSLKAELSVTTEKRQTDVDRLQQQLRVAEDTVVKLMEECRVAHDTVEESNRQIKALEGVCANNLIASQTALSSSHSEKNDVINERALLSEQYNTLRKELDMATAASLAAQNVHTITAGDLQAKLAGSQDSLRLALLDCSSAREEIKVITEEHQKQLAEKGVEMSTMQAKLRDVEATRAVALREQEEVRARLSAQLAKHAADQASSEEELREMEGQLKSFVDVCNSTRLVLVGAQEDLRVSEQRRKEDADSFLVKLKESGQANSVLAGRTEEDRAKFVALEMQAIAVASSGETGLDNVQQQLEISEAERRRVSVSADEMKAGLIIARQEIAELQAKRDTDLSVLQSKVEELQREKQSSINANDALTVRLTSALEVISFFEKEREEDIMSMQRELKESAKARKKIIADFDVARGDLAAAEVTLRNSLPVSPSRSNGSRSPVTPPPHTPEAKSPVLPLIEAAIMKQMVSDLTMARDSAESECALLQSKLDNAIFDYEELKAMRSIEIQQMEDALEALECLESERNALHSECEKLTLLLGMPVQRSTAAANTGVSVGAGVSTGMSGSANTGAGVGATVAASGSEGVSLSAGVSRTADEDTDKTDSVAAAEVEDNVLSPVLPTPARPASLNLRGRSSTKEAPALTRSTSQKGVRPGHGSSMATTSNPMLGPSNPMRMRPASASSLLPTDLNAPKPLIMTSSRLWANAKTVALMTVRGKRASNATSTPLSPLSDINSPEVKSTDQLNESVKAELENLRKVKQTLGTNLLSATEAINAAVNSISTPEWASPATKSAVRDLKMQYDQNDVDATQSLSQKSNNREEEDDDWVLRSALQKPRLPLSPHDAKTPNNEPVDEDSTEICSFTSPFSTHHSPSTSPCPVDTKTSRKFDRASGSIPAVDNPVSESKGGGEGGVVVGESEGYTFRSVTVIGDGVSILNKNENGDGTEYDDDDSPMTVPSGDGSKNPFGFPLGDGTDPANSELKENCEDSGEPTPEEGGSPLSQTSTVRSYGSGSERLPLPQAIGGKAALRKSETAKPRFVTTGGVVDPIPPSRLSIATKTTK